MNKITAVVAAAILFPATLAAMPPASQWEIGPWVRGKNYSVGMPETPEAARDGGLAVEFPRAGRGEWDALTTGVRSLEGVSTITVRFRIDAAPRTRFVAVETPGEPATVSLYFQRANDNWTGRGRYGFYRWYAPHETLVKLSPGVHTMRLRLDDRWGSVNGKPSSDYPREFAAAKADAAKFGLAFGSATRRSHGVAATGPARFTLLSVDFD